MLDTFHTIVIGAGSGGLTVAVGLANLGKPVAVVEGRYVGGDCTNVGCVPSKTLIHQAAACGATGTDALAAVRHKRDALRDKETDEFGELPNLSLVLGRARLLDRHRVAVALADGGQRVLTAEQIVVASGSRPHRIEIAGLPAERMLTNETVWELPSAPQHLAIVGGGVIGMELAFAFRKLGSRVSVITTAPRVLDKFLPDVSEALDAALRERNIAVYAGAGAHAYDAASETLRIQQNGRSIALDGVDYVLVAVGRRRNVAGLGLEAAGVRFDVQKGIFTDAYGRTNVAHIYAIGDVTPTSRYTHSANAQGRRVVQRIAFPWLPARGREPLYPSATFSDPEVATVGLRPEQLARRYHPGLVKRIRIDLVTQTDRGYTDDLRRGFIIVDAMRLTGRILAVTIVGPRASEMISLFTLAMEQGLSLYKLYRIVYPYPTFSSGIQKVADTFLRDTLPNVRGELAAYLRYRWARPERLAGGNRTQPA